MHVDTQSLRFDFGDEICGWGRLVRTVDGDWFDPPTPVRLSRFGPPGPPPPRASRHRIRIEEANFDAVEHRSERDGFVQGYATVCGQWQGDRIAVHRQTQDRPDRHRRRRSDPPCPPPPGGWPHGMNGRSIDNLDFEIGDLQETGAAVTVTIFRPSDTQAVLVIAATDIAAVERQLRPQLPDRLCVVPSRWTPGQLHRAGDYLRKKRELWRIYTIGSESEEQAQATVTAGLVRITDEVADWITTQPDGLIELRPWLTPLPAEQLHRASTLPPG